MRPVPSLLRTLVLVVIVGFVSSCSASPKSAGGGAGLPSLQSVMAGRFVAPVALDNGALVVVPARSAKPHVTMQAAQAMFGAADVVNGAFRFSILGLGDATVSPAVAPATTTTAGPGNTVTTTTAGPGPGTTTSTSAARATTTTTPLATTTTATGVGATTTTPTTAVATPPTTAPLPRYDGRLAWVGMAWGADCPARAGRPPLATRYVVVVIDALTGASVIDYTSRSSLACNGPVLAPSISRPNELVSVPWQPVGPTSTAVRVTMPACSTYFGWTQLPGQGAPSVQVVARKPFDPSCGSEETTVQIVDNVVPLGTGQSTVPHAPLGPVDGLHTLPGG